MEGFRFYSKTRELLAVIFQIKQNDFQNQVISLNLPVYWGGCWRQKLTTADQKLPGFKCESLNNLVPAFQIDGRLEHVPSSRADVFGTRHISVVEKRILMKFLSCCLNQDVSNHK